MSRCRQSLMAKGCAEDSCRNAGCSDRCSLHHATAFRCRRQPRVCLGAARRWNLTLSPRNQKGHRGPLLDACLTVHPVGGKAALAAARAPAAAPTGGAGFPQAARQWALLA